MAATTSRRAFLAVTLSVALLVTILIVTDDSSVSVLQDTFYELAKKSLRKERSQFDQMAFSRSQGPGP